MAAIAVACLIAAARWLMLAGLAGALGGLAGRGLARQYKGTAPRRCRRRGRCGSRCSAWLRRPA